MKNTRASSVIAVLGLAAVFPSVVSAYEVAAQRETYTALKSQRGTTVTIPVATIEDLCGDVDGCKLRMGMYDWDGSGRTASAETLFYYNTTTRTWRADWNDRQGTNLNTSTEFPLIAYSCYLTDGKYTNWSNQGDHDLDFGLLSWDEYYATCNLTIID